MAPFSAHAMSAFCFKKGIQQRLQHMLSGWMELRREQAEQSGYDFDNNAARRSSEKYVGICHAARRRSYQQNGGVKTEQSADGFEKNTTRALERQALTGSSQVSTSVRMPARDN